MIPDNLQEHVRLLNSFMREPVMASQNVERDLETHIRQYEVPFNLEPLDRDLREQRSNEIARYHNARKAAGFYKTTEGLQVADAEFVCGNYVLKAILRDDQHLYLRVQIIDQETGIPGSVDLSNRIRLIIAKPNGREVVSSPITSDSRAQFNFAVLRPTDYVARIQSLTKIV